ncbi:MAG: hypothetical protein JF597_04890 [Streptomyces sp.]|jgi:hypothetical protein|uniref:hypothetical protein n=1 Tax=unclassified Streptomyces TaxID=2593676 RepID=UPI0025F8EFD4|nr:hypothetical protein [Streptomyces sp.]MBW8792933.1 hypothetical protein [Streptomyces sp.]
MLKIGQLAGIREDEEPETQAARLASLARTLRALHERLDRLQGAVPAAKAPTGVSP